MGRAELNLVLYVFGIVTIPSSVYGGACPEIQAPSGAAMSFTGQISEGTTITAVCTNGGMINGAQCLPMLAPSGATLTYGNGSMNSGFAGLQIHGTTVTMKCNDNTPVTGASNAVCQNGIWIPPVLGSCISSGVSGILPSNNMLTPFAGGEIMCHFGLIAPLNGDIEYSSGLPASAGATATLTCRAGYTVRGNSVSTCQNGIFGMLGTCEKAK
ncbi:unnamed protein product [Angiostrongylus costaricensis]|uniref:Sushi domain-containing protein n=1 Tax=Angiostrongylus costaricensis TaxID=334426 RepID=A0A0R3PM06_ANGCS|nr:unnamed protein product [Angiostrongylus costaricensis]